MGVINLPCTGGGLDAAYFFLILLAAASSPLLATILKNIFSHVIDPFG